MKVIELIKMTFEKSNIPVISIGSDLKIDLGNEHVYFIEHNVPNENNLIIREIRNGQLFTNEKLLSINELNNKIELVTYRFRQQISLN